MKKGKERLERNSRLLVLISIFYVLGLIAGCWW